LRELVRLAWRNMWRNWRRTAIALVAIVLGLVLLIFMDGLIKGSDQAIFGNAVRVYGGNIQIHAPGYRERARRLPLFPLADADAVVSAASALPEVASASRRIVTSGMVASRDGSHAVSITGIEPSREAPRSIVAENVAQGRFLADTDADAVLIGKGLADVLEVSAGDKVTVVGRSRHETMRQRTMTVIGVFDLGMTDAEKGMVFIPLSEAQTLYKLRDQATEVVVSLPQIGPEPQVISALETALPGYEVDSWKTLRPELQQTIDTKFAFTSFFGMVVLLIACIGILNLLMMAVFERTREMGVLAALGMRARQILLLFLLEGTLIGVVGGVIGAILGMGAVSAMGRIGIDISYASGMGEITALLGSRLYPQVTTADAIGRGITVALIAALASLYPAWQASRRQPAEVLHHV
jgi:ABC-type lipoprotein release transport system permease subunit